MIPKPENMPDRFFALSAYCCAACLLHKAASAMHVSLSPVNLQGIKSQEVNPVL
jgi:hypothetical protein